MEQFLHYAAAQKFVDAVTGTSAEERHSQQHASLDRLGAERQYLDGENRAQRRERERREKKAAMRARKNAVKCTTSE